MKQLNVKNRPNVFLIFPSMVRLIVCLACVQVIQLHAGYVIVISMLYNVPQARLTFLVEIDQKSFPEHARRTLRLRTGVSKHWVANPLIYLQQE